MADQKQNVLIILLKILDKSNNIVAVRLLVNHLALLMMQNNLVMLDLDCLHHRLHINTWTGGEAKS